MRALPCLPLLLAITLPLTPCAPCLQALPDLRDSLPSNQITDCLGRVATATPKFFREMHGEHRACEGWGGYEVIGGAGAAPAA